MSTLLNQISVDNFRNLFRQLIDPRRLQTIVRAHRRSPAGARPRVGPYDLILGMVFHALLPWGLLLFSAFGKCTSPAIGKCTTPWRLIMYDVC